MSVLMSNVGQLARRDESNKAAEINYILFYLPYLF